MGRAYAGCIGKRGRQHEEVGRESYSGVTPVGAPRPGDHLPQGGGFDPEAFLRQRLGPDSRNLYAEIHRELDRLVLPRVLEHTGGNQARAALLLGIARRTLRAKLHEVGLHVGHSGEAHENDRL